MSCHNTKGYGSWRWITTDHLCVTAGEAINRNKAKKIECIPSLSLPPPVSLFLGGGGRVIFCLDRFLYFPSIRLHSPVPPLPSFFYFLIEFFLFFFSPSFSSFICFLFPLRPVWLWGNTKENPHSARQEKAGKNFGQYIFLHDDLQKKK